MACARARAMMRGRGIPPARSMLLAPDALGGRNSTARLNPHTDVEHRKLSSPKSPEQHDLVEVTKMANAKQLAGNARQAGAECKIVTPKRHIDDFRRVDIRRHHD